MIGLEHYLVLSAVLFCIGLYRRAGEEKRRCHTDVH